MTPESTPRYGFKILNPAHYLDALLFWSVYTSTSILILWLLTSEAKNVFRSSAASHILSLTTTTASALSQETRLYSSDNLQILDAILKSNQSLLAGGAIYQTGPKGALNELIALGNPGFASLDFLSPANLPLIERAATSPQPLFSEWSVLSNRKLPTWLRPSQPLEFSFTRLDTGPGESPAVLVLAFNAPVIEERFLEVDSIAAFMVALSIIVATCLAFVVRFRSIQRVKANRERLAAIQLLERRGAILNAVARAADRLLSRRDAENTLNDLLLEIRPRMEVNFLYASLDGRAAGAPASTLGSAPKEGALDLARLAEPQFERWRKTIDAERSVNESRDQWEDDILDWARVRQLHSIILFPIHRDQHGCGLLVAEYLETQTPIDRTFIDILNVTADLFSAALTQREHNERMVQSSKMEALGRMAGGVAHEFNNLLHIISGNLRRLDHGREDEKQLVKKILGASDRGSAIVEQLLRATRQKHTRLVPASLNHIVEQTADLAARALGKETHVVTRLAPDLPAVMADEGQIQQVILNLLLNARDAQGGKGTIHLRTYRQDHVVACEVRDSGPGIAAVDLDHLFDPFFTTKPPGEGTGLGLSTSKGILEQHGGTIEARNTPEGGACFTFSLPVPASLPQPSPPAPAGNLASQPSHEQAVLIADDEELCREVICDILRDQGHRVLAAASGEEAIALARRHADEIGWVVTDWTMPGLHGLPLLEQLKKILPAAPLLVASGYVISGEDVPLMDGFIAKPFTPETLLQALASHPPDRL